MDIDLATLEMAEIWHVSSVGLLTGRLCQAGRLAPQEDGLGNCEYCGKPAGFLRTKHAECEDKHQQRELVIQEGRDRIATEVLHALKISADFDKLENTISNIEQSHFVTSCDSKNILVNGWEIAVDQFLEDGILDSAEEQRLVKCKEHFALSQNDLNKNGALTKTVKAAVLRDVLNGLVPQRISVAGSLPINFQKGEQVIWAFSDSKYLEDKIRREYIGSSKGVSIRVMKGVYYRVGAFKGHAIEHTERVHIDTGWLVLTTKNLYFAGQVKSIRLPYTKIVSFEPFSDGIAIMRDAASAKPQTFVTGDGWFTYNLVTNLSQM